MTVTIKINEVEYTLDEAKELYNELGKLFGEQVTVEEPDEDTIIQTMLDAEA